MCSINRDFGEGYQVVDTQAQGRFETVVHTVSPVGSLLRHLVDEHSVIKISAMATRFPC